ncbi:MAG: AraC family ligand binding domain-containing protein, partial [Selenomonadaceae bacterium]|nr:AraC family ligand binding domain-containing protein [Selenomonadaceae bacterium]
CGHYFCTDSYFMERETYPYVLVIFVRDGNMDVRYNGKNYLIGKGDVLLIDCVNPHISRSQRLGIFVCALRRRLLA